MACFLGAPYAMSMRMIRLALLLLFATTAHAADRQQAVASRDAFYWQSLIGRGVNFGNTLEAPEEGAWGVRLEEAYFDAIADAGFNSVRIPVRWSAHADETAPYTIDPGFVDRVDWAIDQALSRGLVAVVNVHHYEELTSEPAANRERFLGLWRQLATHYADYPPRLYFELLNEPCRELTPELWNAYLIDALRVVRESNPDRAVIIGPGNWNNVLQLPELRLPPDDKNLIATFHYYLPFQFTHQGASWVGKQSQAWLGTEWTGSAEEAAAVEAHFDGAVHWAKTQSVPLYLGEFGCMSSADAASRRRWTTFVRREAERRGITWTYWDFCTPHFGAYDRKTSDWRDDFRASLLGDGD